MDTSTLLLIGAAAYWFFLRPGAQLGAPGQPVTGRTGAGGTQITIPGYAQYTQVPGVGTSIQIDPRLFSIFGAGTSQPQSAQPAPASVYESAEPYAAPYTSPPSDPFYLPPSPEQLDICWSDPYNPVCYGGAI